MSDYALVPHWGVFVLYSVMEPNPGVMPATMTASQRWAMIELQIQKINVKLELPPLTQAEIDLIMKA